MFPGIASLSSLLDLRQLGDYAKIAVRGASHRAELAGIELAEAKAEATASLLMIAFTGVFIMLFGVAVTFLVAASVWDGPHRVPVLAGLSGLYLVAAVVLGLWVRRRIAAWKPFAATADQIRKDTECLEKIISTPEA